MNLDLPLILTLAVFVTGLIWLADKYYFAPKRVADGVEKANMVLDFGRSFFPPLLLVWFIRAFLGQAFIVPTGSLEPTIVPVEFVLVKQYAYGLRLPVLHYKLAKWREPKVGEIAVFRWPVNTHVNFIKRVIGTPGDHVQYKDKVLYINGVKATQRFIRSAEDIEPSGNMPVQEFEENINGVKHRIYRMASGGQDSDFDLIVPPHHYFMMGDNRDDSDDSRGWGFVPESNLIGQGAWIVLSWDSTNYRIRWQRMGTAL